MDPGPELVGERPGVAQQLLGGERKPLDPDAHLDPAVRGAVLGVERTRVVREPVEIVLVGRHVVREHGSDADLLGGVRERLQLAVHVVDRRHAAPNRLGVAGQRRPVRALGVERPDHGVPAGLQVLPQRKVIAPPFAQRGVVMQIDQPGHHHLSGGVNHRRAFGPHRIFGPGDRRDPIPVDHDRSAEQHVVVIVEGQDDPVADDQPLAHAHDPFGR